jgi:hypothetical protein
MSVLISQGDNYVTEEELRQIPVPQGTQTWYPIGHSAVLDAVRSTLTSAGYEVVAQSLAVANNGLRFFGTLDLSVSILDGVMLAIGIRNSMDRSIPIEFCAGARVMVCTNLSFYSQVAVSRRHTKHGAERYMEGISLSVQQLAEHQLAQSRWMALLQDHRLETHEAESIILRSYEQKLIGSRQLPLVIDEWRHPQFDHGGETGWSLWNTFTHVLGQDANPAKAALRTIRLQSLFPEVIDGQVVNQS